MKRIYVGCSLTQASGEFKAFVAAFKRDLAAECEILEFKGLIDGTNADVFEHDLGNVRAADALVFIVDYPAIGLGMEIGEALTLKKPILCLHAPGASVTRMLKGAAELGYVASMQEYASLEDAVQKAARFIESV